jgi:endonuclease YncB( thermonuclease family)
MQRARAALLLFAAVLGGAASFARAETPFTGPYAAEVLRVVDGDTFDARIEVWPSVLVEIRVRLKGVDTPETLKARCRAERDLGERATAYARAQLSGRPVSVRDLSRDKYGRTLARAFVGEEELAALLIAQGLARAYDGGRRAGWCEGKRP